VSSRRSAGRIAGVQRRLERVEQADEAVRERSRPPSNRELLAKAATVRSKAVEYRTVAG
jgi:hypothetical protein